MTTMVESEAAVLAARKAELDQLLVEIKREHEATARSMGDSLRHAREVGRKLIAVKAILAHGQFMPWVEEECGFSHSTANLYMKIARNWDERLLGNSERVQSISLHQAAELLRSRDTSAQERTWSEDLDTTLTLNSCNRLMKEVRLFGERLQGPLGTDMAFVLRDRAVLHKATIENLCLWFLDLRKEVDKCVEALRRRHDGAPVTWGDSGPTLLEIIDVKPTRVRSIALSPSPEAENRLRAKKSAS